MRDMHALGSKLPRQTLTQRSQCEFGTCKRAEERRTFHGGSSAGEYECGGVRRRFLGGGEQQGEGEFGEEVGGEAASEFLVGCFF